MIRIAKTDSIPAILTTRGAAATQTNRDLYDANPAAYDAGIHKFDINADIYGHESVKTQLIDEQAGKCCFCEADFTANGYGDVEHFRPKAGYQITPSGKLNRPGYYWLAYDWQNLFFSCQICNQQYKKNYLPLDDEAQRARNHLFDHQAETLAILHPAIDNPADHLTFNQHVISDITPKGKKSIKGFGLDRTKLNHVREQYLQNVRTNFVFAGLDLNSVTEAEKTEWSVRFNVPWAVLESTILTAKEFVAKAARADQPFALMVRSNFPGLPHE